MHPGDIPAGTLHKIEKDLEAALGKGVVAMTDAYTAHVRWQDGEWRATVHDVPGAHTYARTLATLRKRLREVIVLMDDRADADVDDESAFTVSLAVQVSVGDDVGTGEHQATAPDQALQLAGDARRRAEQAEAEAEHATTIAVLMAQGAGIGLRDSAVLLGISYQRVQQIAAAADSRARDVVREAERHARQEVATAASKGAVMRKQARRS